MMTCPRCSERVPAKSIWTAAGLAGVVCPHCRASLCPQARCAVVLFAVSFGLGDAALFFLRSHGADFWLAFTGFFVVFACVCTVAGPLILSWRLKDYSEPNLSGRRA